MATIEINNAPVRTINATVFIYNSDKTQVRTYTSANKIKSIEIQRTGEPNKFFGFGITHKLNLKLIDPNREINITTDNFILPRINSVYYPYCFVTEVHRDENTNELSITAYDAIYFKSNYTVGDLGLVPPYDLYTFIVAAGYSNNNYWFIDGIDVNTTNSLRELTYQEGANFNTDYKVREALTAAAEVLGCVYYMTFNGTQHRMVFEPLGTNEITIDKENYFTLKVSNNRRLAAVCSATELGDNVIYESGVTGTTQYLRDNPFIDIREDVATIVESIFNSVGNISIAQFDLDWRGNNKSLPPGTKINLVGKDGTKAISYLINETVSYDGSLRSKLEWKYENALDGETAANPSTLGAQLKKTYAKVDKVNQQIELVAKDVSDYGEAISQLQIDTNTIKGSVSSVQTNLDKAVEGLNGDIEKVNKRVDLAITDEQVQIKIDKAMEKGTTAVTTSTGFTFNQDGLTVAKSGSEMTTTISEDGMTVYRDNIEVLTADNTGVKARNLHAETYLIIGNNSRFEDYTNTSGQQRTGCFWIG